MITLESPARAAPRAGDRRRRGLLHDGAVRLRLSGRGGFLRSFAAGDLVVANLVEDDLGRMAQLVEQYAGFPLEGSDASVVAIAKGCSITTILTTDRRFAAVRPKHVEAFDLLP